MKQAIESLFRVTGLRAEMCDKQKAFGILLDSCGLIGMTKDAIAQEVEDMKSKLFLQVRIR